jgi:LysM repeat protein
MKNLLFPQQKRKRRKRKEMDKSLQHMKPIAIIVLICLSFLAHAQNLQIQGIAPHAHLMHKVQAKENWYSVGRIYNLSPREIAPFNQLSIDQPLAIGQSLKIPLTSNFSTDGQIASDESLIPIYHKVADKEWAYRISTNYQVPVESLEAFNKIKKEQVKAGMPLIVGFLKVKTDQSPLASKAVKVTPVQTSVAAAPVPAATTANTTPTATPTANTKTAPSNAEPVVATSTPVQPKKEPVTTKSEPPPTSVVNTKPVVVSDPPVPEKQSDRTLTARSSYFQSSYEGGGKSGSGSAHIFKSSSGFTDGKFYALINAVPVGTIIKVSAQGKTIYAKVLGGLTDMKENQGIALRISNAAAAMLGTGDAKFTAEWNY